MPWIYDLKEGQSLYFASDFHLGAPNYEQSVLREKRIISWMDSIKPTARALFLLGDVFDFWFEYKKVIPKGFVRFQGKLAEWSDAEIPIHVFTGNHDMWLFDYFEKEMGLHIHRDLVELQSNEKSFLIGHGDGLGLGDFTYKILKKIFRNPLMQWLFARVHPNLGIAIAHKWSLSSRKLEGDSKMEYLGDEKEMLVQYILKAHEKWNKDYYLFGHRHFPLRKKIHDALYINTGDWLRYSTFAEFDGSKLELKDYSSSFNKGGA